MGRQFISLILQMDRGEDLPRGKVRSLALLLPDCMSRCCSGVSLRRADGQTRWTDSQKDRQAKISPAVIQNPAVWLEWIWLEARGKVRITEVTGTRTHFLGLSFSLTFHSSSLPNILIRYAERLRFPPQTPEFLMSNHFDCRVEAPVIRPPLSLNALNRLEFNDCGSESLKGTVRL